MFFLSVFVDVSAGALASLDPADPSADRGPQAIKRRGRRGKNVRAKRIVRRLTPALQSRVDTAALAGLSIHRKTKLTAT
jgi:hypothetical protein